MGSHRSNGRKRASKKQKTVSEQALRLAGYVVLLTTVEEDLLSNEELLQLYRVRWQIELFFKRCKSILNLDRIAAHDAALARTFVLAKLIEGVVFDRLCGRWRDRYAQSLLGRDCRRPSLSEWRLVKIAQLGFRTATFSAFAARPVEIDRYFDALDTLRERRRKRTDASRLVVATHDRLNCGALTAPAA